MVLGNNLPNTPKRGRGRPRKTLPAGGPPPDLVAQPDAEIVINAPLARRPTTPLDEEELPPFLRLDAPAPVAATAQPAGAQAFIAYLEERAAARRQALGVRVLPDDPPVPNAPRRRLYERRYPLALDAGAVAAQREAGPPEAPSGGPVDARRWALTERVLWYSGLGLLICFGLVLVLSGLAAWSTQGSGRPVAAPASVAHMTPPTPGAPAPPAATPLVIVSNPPDNQGPPPPTPLLIPAAAATAPPAGSQPVMYHIIPGAAPGDPPIIFYSAAPPPADSPTPALAAGGGPVADTTNNSANIPRSPALPWAAYTGEAAPPFVPGYAPVNGPSAAEGEGITGCTAPPFAPNKAPCPPMGGNK